jgi:hypothetical protein
MKFENGVGPGKCIFGGDINVIPCADPENYVMVGTHKCMHKSQFNDCE